MDEEKCVKCGANDFEEQIVYDEDGVPLCTDCLFEQESNRWEDRRDNYWDD